MAKKKPDDAAAEAERRFKADLKAGTLGSFYIICGEEAFPWVRGYGNFLQGRKYDEQYQKISKYIMNNKEKKILFLELGVGRMTPMFIQEPFWKLTNSLKDAYYISVNSEYQFLPEFIEDKGIAILGDIGTVLKDLRKAKEESAFVC